MIVSLLDKLGRCNSWIQSAIVRPLGLQQVDGVLLICFVARNILGNNDSWIQSAMERRPLTLQQVDRMLLTCFVVRLISGCGYKYFQGSKSTINAVYVTVGLHAAFTAIASLIAETQLRNYAINMIPTTEGEAAQQRNYSLKEPLISLLNSQKDYDKLQIECDLIQHSIKRQTEEKKKKEKETEKAEKETEARKSIVRKQKTFLNKVSLCAKTMNNLIIKLSDIKEISGTLDTNQTQLIALSQSNDAYQFALEKAKQLKGEAEKEEFKKLQLHTESKTKYKRACDVLKETEGTHGSLEELEKKKCGNEFLLNKLKEKKPVQAAASQGLQSETSIARSTLENSIQTKDKVAEEVLKREGYIKVLEKLIAEKKKDSDEFHALYNYNDNKFKEIESELKNTYSLDDNAISQLRLILLEQNQSSHSDKTKAKKNDISIVEQAKQYLLQKIGNFKPAISTATPESKINDLVCDLQKVWNTQHRSQQSFSENEQQIGELNRKKQQLEQGDLLPNETSLNYSLEHAIRKGEDLSNYQVLVVEKLKTVSLENLIKVRDRLVAVCTDKEKDLAKKEAAVMARAAAHKKYEDEYKEQEPKYTKEIDDAKAKIEILEDLTKKKDEAEKEKSEAEKAYNKCKEKRLKCEENINTIPDPNNPTRKMAIEDLIKNGKTARSDAIDNFGVDKASADKTYKDLLKGKTAFDSELDKINFIDLYSKVENSLKRELVEADARQLQQDYDELDKKSILSVWLMTHVYLKAIEETLNSLSRCHSDLTNDQKSNTNQSAAFAAKNDSNDNIGSTLIDALRQCKLEKSIEAATPEERKPSDSEASEQKSNETQTENLLNTKKETLEKKTTMKHSRGDFDTAVWQGSQRQVERIINEKHKQILLFQREKVNAEIKYEKKVKDTSYGSHIADYRKQRNEAIEEYLTHKEIILKEIWGIYHTVLRIVPNAQVYGSKRREYFRNLISIEEEIEIIKLERQRTRDKRDLDYQFTSDEALEIKMTNDLKQIAQRKFKQKKIDLCGVEEVPGEIHNNFPPLLHAEDAPEFTNFTRECVLIDIDCVLDQLLINPEANFKTKMQELNDLKEPNATADSENKTWDFLSSSKATYESERNSYRKFQKNLPDGKRPIYAILTDNKQLLCGEQDNPLFNIIEHKALMIDHIMYESSEENKKKARNSYISMLEKQNELITMELRSLGYSEQQNGRQWFQYEGAHSDAIAIGSAISAVALLAMHLFPKRIPSPTLYGPHRSALWLLCLNIQSQSLNQTHVWRSAAFINKLFHECVTGARQWIKQFFNPQGQEK